MKSHWACYREEYAGTKFIEHEFGFVSYSLLPDCIFIEDIWVAPEQRKSGLGQSLIEEAEAVGRAEKKLFSLVRIDLNAATIPGNLKAALAIDFIPFRADNNQIWLKRNIEV